MKIFLDETYCREALFPLTYTRHVADIRLGILTIREKWRQLTGAEPVTEQEAGSVVLSVPANLVPNASNFQAILQEAAQVVSGFEQFPSFQYPWDLFRMNDQAIRHDFALLTEGRSSACLSATNRVSGTEQVFVEAGARVEYSTINATTGPVYIGKDAEVMEGNLIRGPFFLGANSVLKMGSKVYNGTSIGPNCVAGGEIKNSILIGNSNKAHDGYLGDSVIGEWCNLGAGTSNSNVKNTGGEVKYIYNANGDVVPAGMKAGLIMGDYSRSAINTSFNTGTIVGVCCNIFGDAPPRFIPNFSWGTGSYLFEKALTDISNWKRMKQQELTSQEREMLQRLYSAGTSSDMLS